MNVKKKNAFRKHSYVLFKDLMNRIMKKLNKNNENDTISNQQIENFNENIYLKQIPYQQELLTQIQMIYTNNVEFSYYQTLKFNFIDTRNLFDIFHGLLFFIFYNSYNKLNTSEIAFHFSGASDLKDVNHSSHFDILNLFDYENIQKQITIHKTKNLDAFFGVTFKRIEITPTFYSIRSGIMQNNLISFVFEAYDKKLNKWVVLDERMNINDLISNGSYAAFSVCSRNKSYSSFQIRQIGVGSQGFLGFSISAFDIHGFVNYKTEESNSNNINFSFDSSCEEFEKNNYCCFYDPFYDMTDCI